MAQFAKTTIYKNSIHISTPSSSATSYLIYKNIMSDIVEISESLLKVINKCKIKKN